MWGARLSSVLALWFPMLTILLQYRKHLYILHLNNAHTRSHSLKCKWSQKSQGRNRSESCNIYWTEDICLQVTELHQHTFQGHNTVPIQLPHTVPFANANWEEKGVNRNYIHKSTGQLSFRMHLCSTTWMDTRCFFRPMHTFLYDQNFSKTNASITHRVSKNTVPAYQAEQQRQWTTEFLTFVLINIPLCPQDTQYSISIFGITKEKSSDKGHGTEYNYKRYFSSTLKSQLLSFCSSGGNSGQIFKNKKKKKTTKIFEVVFNLQSSSKHYL